MKHTDSSLHSISGPGWQLLGGLALSSDTHPTVGKWLAVILGPLDLPADFMKKVLNSAHEATARPMPSEASARFEHIRLLVFVTTPLSSQRQSWGFFRIEKIESAVEGKNICDHAIEFYLYGE
jgi:hypothetical protein